MNVRIAGIDLGTTFSGLAILNDIGKSEIVANKEGERITPSAVYFSDNGKILVGSEAVKASASHPERSVSWIKQHMKDAEYRIEIGEQSFTPSDISSMILKKLIQDAVQQKGKVSHAVISTPANFGEVARKATMEAGAKAGLNIIGIVNEPTAAALYYAKEHDVSGRVMVFDLGGGTFDVSIVDIYGTDIRVLHSEGDCNLGGVNFDLKLLKYFEEQYKEQKGSPLYEDECEKKEFTQYAEDIKKSLSKIDSTTVRLKGSAGLLKMETTRLTFESLISSEVARVGMLVETALEKSDNEPSDIADVLLVGGSSRIPIFKELLVKMFDREPRTVGNVDECVALGASVFAGLRLKEENCDVLPVGISEALKGTSLGEICNNAYGTICLEMDPVTRQLIDKNKIMIPKSTPLPAMETKTFYTATEGQEVIKVVITEGETTDADIAQQRDNFEFKLPPGLPDREPIEVTYCYDKDQRMKCSFLHKDSGTQISRQYDMATGSKVDDDVQQDFATIEDFEIE